VKRARINPVSANADSNEDEPSEFMLLPNEIHTMLCGFLPVKDRLRFGSTCHRFFQLENEAAQKYFHLVDVIDESDGKVRYKIEFSRIKSYTFFIDDDLLEEQKERARNIFKRARIRSLSLKNLKSAYGIPDLNLLSTSTYSYLHIRNFMACPEESVRFANSFINSDNFTGKMLYLSWIPANAKEVPNNLRFFRTISGMKSFNFWWDVQMSVCLGCKFLPEMDAMTLLDIAGKCRDTVLHCSIRNISGQDLRNVFKVVYEAQEFRSIHLRTTDLVLDEMIGCLGDEIK
ncbi:hypothetical protein PFISCL1PPCAC_11728, partial [Pristionchus fissidentatus]